MRQVTIGLERVWIDSSLDDAPEPRRLSARTCVSFVSARQCMSAGGIWHANETHTVPPLERVLFVNEGGRSDRW
jgi:hypothetical protein